MAPILTLILTSSAFKPLGPMPARFTCEGADVSPPLAWRDVPKEAKSLAIVVDDPDAPDPHAPTKTWVHWVVYNLPPALTGLPEAATLSDLPAGTRFGRNDFLRYDYGGPCPPIGRHRYFHKLYALDVMLPVLTMGTKNELVGAMAGHVLATGELIGTYAKAKQ